MKRLVGLFILLLLVVPSLTLAQEQGHERYVDSTTVREWTMYFPVPGSNCTEGYAVSGTLTSHYWIQAKNDGRRAHIHQDSEFISYDSNHRSSGGFNIIINSIDLVEYNGQLTYTPNVMQVVGQTDLYDPDGLALSQDLTILRLVVDENGNVHTEFRGNPTVTCYR